MEEQFESFSAHAIALIELAKTACVSAGAGSSKTPQGVKSSQNLAESLGALQEVVDGTRDFSDVEKAVADSEQALRLLDQALDSLGASSAERTGHVQAGLKSLRKLRRVAAGGAATRLTEDAERGAEELSDVFDALLKSTVKRVSSRSLMHKEDAKASDASTAPGESGKAVGLSHASLADSGKTPEQPSPPAQGETIPKQLRPGPRRRVSQFGTLKRDASLAKFTSVCGAAGCRCQSFGSNVWQKNRCVNCMHLLDKHQVEKQTPDQIERYDTLRRQKTVVEMVDSPVRPNVGVTTPTKSVTGPTRRPVAKADNPKTEREAETSDLPKEKAAEPISASPPAEAKPRNRKSTTIMPQQRPQLTTRATMFMTKLDTEMLKSSPAHYFAKLGHVDELRKLSQEVPATDLWKTGNANLQTPLHVALESEQEGCAKFLLEKYASASEKLKKAHPLALKDKVGRTHLIYAARFGVEFVLKEMIAIAESSRLVDLLETDMFGDSALHVAAANGHVGCASLIIKAGTEDDSAMSEVIERQNNFQETPLHKAARGANLAMVELLLSAGADVDAKASQGVPLDVIPPTVDPKIYARLHQLLESSSGERDMPAPMVDDAAKIRQAARDLSDGNERFDEALAEVYGSNSDAPEKGAADPVGLLIARPKVTDICVYRCSKNSVGLSSSCSDSDDENEAMAVSIAAVDDLSNCLEGLFEPFRNSYFNKRFFTFCIEDLSAGEDPAEPAVFVAKRSPSSGVYEGLFLNKWGFNPFLLPETAIAKYVLRLRGADQQSDARAVLSSATSTEIETAMLQFLAKLSEDGTVLDFSPEFDAKTRKSAQQFMEAMSPVKSSSSDVSTKRRSKKGLLGTPFSNRKRKNRAKRLSRKAANHFSWYQIQSPSVSGALLGLEAKLGRGSANSFGLVNCLPGQSREEELFRNKSSVNFNNFCSILGDEVDLRGWSGYSGGFDTSADIRSTYSSWRGFEVMWHPAPAMDAEQQRSLLGNDKVVVYYLDHPTTPFEPRLRGNVNSVGIVVAEHDDGFYVEAFSRSRVQGFHPELPCVAFKHDQKTQLRDWIIATAMNATTAVYQSSPYVYMLASAWNQALLGFVESFPRPTTN